MRLSINATYFGVEWANGPECDQVRYAGTITKWKSKASDEVMIKWDGWERNKATKLSQLVGVDEDGEALECQLEAYEDGRAAPTFVEQAAAPAAEEGSGGGRTGGGDGYSGEEDDEDEPRHGAAGCASRSTLELLGSDEAREACAVLEHGDPASG